MEMEVDLVILIMIALCTIASSSSAGIIMTIMMKGALLFWFGYFDDTDGKVPHYFDLNILMIMMERRCIILCIFLKAFPISSAASDLIHFRHIRLKWHLLKLHPSLPHRLSYVEMSLRKSETSDRTETIFLLLLLHCSVGGFLSKVPRISSRFLWKSFIIQRDSHGSV